MESIACEGTANGDALKSHLPTLSSSEKASPLGPSPYLSFTTDSHRRSCSTYVRVAATFELSIISLIGDLVPLSTTALLGIGCIGMAIESGDDAVASGSCQLVAIGRGGGGDGGGGGGTPSDVLPKSRRECK